MPLSRADLDHYCKRIGFDGTLRCDLATLQRLHQLHPQAIAFENIDSWLGRPVSLDPASVFDKLVTRRRGGYCFEQNLLFREVLEALGFQVRGLAARVVWNLPADLLLPRTHMLLLILLDGRRFIADVGFGGLTLTAPLELDSTAVQTTAHEAVRIVHDGEHHVLQANVADSWQALYRFGLEEQMPVDYAMTNWYVGTHPQSRFVQQLIAGRAAPGMRHALLDGRYTRHYLGKASEQRALTNAPDLRRVLCEDLGIDLTGLPELDARMRTLFLPSQTTETDP
jgi:N-hydroxyarylamine O-acetyltransferase